MDDSPMPRITRDVTTNSERQITAMATMLLSVPRISRVDAVVVPSSGMGGPERERLLQGIRLRNRFRIRHLLVAGEHPEEPDFVIHSTRSLMRRPYNLEDPNNVWIQPDADNSKRQAEWIVAKLAKLQITSLALFVSQYHILRQVLTILAAAKASEADLPRIPNTQLPAILISPMPTYVPPSAISEESGLSAWDLVPGEVDRILKYQQNGDVLSYEDFVTYLNWVWEQLRVVITIH